MLTTWKHSAIGLGVAACIHTAPAAHAQSCARVDLNLDGIENLIDIVDLYNDYWGDAGGDADFDNSGLVDGLDLAYMLAHLDIDENGCLPLPVPAPDDQVEFIVRDVSGQDDLDADRRRYELVAKFGDPESTVLSVVNANVGCTKPPCFIVEFMEGSHLSIGADIDPYPDPNFSMMEFEAGTGLGDDAGWWATAEFGEHPGRAGNYPNLEVQLAQFVTPETSDLAGELSIVWRTTEHDLYASTGRFEIEPSGDCYADFNDDDMVNVLDFIAFQDAFANYDIEADCDNSGYWDIVDFICFQGEFQEGCP